MEDLINGRYRLGERVGRGGPGKVHAGLDLNDASACTLRLIPSEPSLGLPRGALPLLEGRVSHPRLERLRAWEPRAGGWLLVSEPLPGLEVLAQAEPLAPARLARILLEALQGIEALGALGLAHGGLSAERILIDSGAG